ncbi:MAG: hypothetical protein LUC24_06060 [Bacteroidales bacterium]|nr:hypothetical protein [Bacteroidales bacterium]
MKTFFRIVLAAAVSASFFSCNNIGDETGYFTDTLTIVNESSHQVDMSEILFYISESNPSSGSWYADSVSLSPSGSADGSDTWSYVNEERDIVAQHSLWFLKPTYATITIDGLYTADLTKDDSDLAINPCVADNWAQEQIEEKDNNFIGTYTLTITEEDVLNAISAFSEVPDIEEE